MLTPAASSFDGPARDPRHREPIFIIGCNRSGTTLLFNNLSSHPETWSLYIEAQDVFHRHFPIHPNLGERVSGPASPAVAEAIRDELYERSHNKEVFKQQGLLRYVPKKLVQRPVGALVKPGEIRLVEKTPANCLRVPLLFSLFPDARFIFLVRRGEDVVSSLMEGWKNWSRSRTGPVWHFTRWHYLVPDGWQGYRDKPLQEICAFQWTRATLQATEDLDRVPASQVLTLRHEEIMSRPREEYDRIRNFCKLSRSAYFERIIATIRARVYTTGGSRPRAEKWRELHENEINSVRHLITPVNQMFYSDQGP